MVSGATSSSACTVTSGSCRFDGSTNYFSRSLTFNAATGIFSGSIVTNECNNHYLGIINNVNYTSSIGAPTATCISQTIPAPAYATFPKAAPLRGTLGYTMSGGVLIYGPFDAGFSKGSACTNNLGSCDSGTDVELCESVLKYQCGVSNFKTYMFLDDCGAHANAYHEHAKIACDITSTTGHSNLVGVALDGRGLYGPYESTGQVPTDLDACGGHYGPVPNITLGSDTYASASNVYHYHVQAKAPFTIGCYGPVSSLNECKSLYSTCGDGTANYQTSDGCYVNYDVDCPCFKHGNTTYNQLVANATCPKSWAIKASLDWLLLLALLI